MSDQPPKDWNVAEREHQIRSPNATDEQCYGTGKIHKSMQWARTPEGCWSERQRELYFRGFDGKPMHE
jgi:hypothetical protein